MQDEDKVVQFCAVAALAKRKTLDKSFAPDLIRIIDDPTGHAGAEAAKALAIIGPGVDGVVPALIRALRNPYAQGVSVEVLGTMGVAAVEAVPLLAELVRDRRRTQSYYAAADALARLSATQKPAFIALARLLNDDDAYTREIARVGFQGLRILPLEALTRCLEDDDPRVRLDAVSGLGRLGSVAKPSLPAILKRLRDDSSKVRAESLLALALVGEGKEVLPGLTEALKDAGPDVRASAVSALGNLGSEAVPAIAEMLGDPDVDVRRQAITALGRIGPAAVRAVPSLIPLLGDPALDRDARRALTWIDPAKAAPAASPFRGDWPQWGGPDRNRVSPETGLLPAWPDGGPPLLWELRGVGKGNPSPVVLGNRIFIIGYYEESEFVTAIDLESRKVLWSTRIGKAIVQQWWMSWLAQRVPTVDAERIYAYHSDGILFCLRTSDGTELWRKEYRAEFGTPGDVWGVGPCDYPLIDSGRLIIAPGGSKATAAALDPATGAVLWQTVSPNDVQASHAALVASDPGGIHQYVTCSLDGALTGFRSTTGRILWTLPPQLRLYGSVVPYGYDSLMVMGSDFIPIRFVRSNGVLSPRPQEYAQGHGQVDHHLFHASVLAFGDSFYSIGSNITRYDIGSGKKVATLPVDGNGSVIGAEGNLYVHQSDGTVSLVGTEGGTLTLKSSFKMPGGGDGATCPVIAGGKLYLRFQNLLQCYDIGADRPPAAPEKTEVVHLPSPEMPSSPGRKNQPQAIFVPTPHDIVRQMLDMAQLEEEEVLTDLGSGDGRVLIEASGVHRHRSVGYEIDETLVTLSRENIRKAELSSRALVRRESFFNADLSPFSVVFVYLPDQMLGCLKSQFAQLRKGSRIVSHQFKIPGVVPERTRTVTSTEDGDPHTIYLYKIPLTPE
jgi:HEAT repeat protein/outer membrane protein assembly factor BamB